MDDFLLERRTAVEGLLGGPILSAARIGGGRNSRVYRIESAPGERYVLKAYFRHPGDPRDRLATEARALAFLRDYGIPCVPAHLASDASQDLGLYEYIEGVPIPDPNLPEVDEACAFLASLGRLRPGDFPLSPASEACFSLAELLENLERRLERLREAAQDHPELSRFLVQDLEPALRRFSRADAAPDDTPDGAILPWEARTLSPSDFGFHNALRTPAGLVFLDFEYFGWDDPAKTIADLLLHPAMDLPAELRGRFVSRLLTELPDPSGQLTARLHRVFPLYGLKWCLILLNEFVPGARERRNFAAPEEPLELRQQRQLARCRHRLSHLLESHDPLHTPTPS